MLRREITFSHSLVTPHREKQLWTQRHHKENGNTRGQARQYTSNGALQNGYFSVLTLFVLLCLFLRKSGNFTERVVNWPNSIHYIYAMMWVFFDFRNFVFWGTTTVGTKLSSTLSMKSCIIAERKEASVPQHMQDTKIATFYKGSQNSAAITDASLWWAFLANCLSV